MDNEVQPRRSSIPSESANGNFTESMSSPPSPSSPESEVFASASSEFHFINTVLLTCSFFHSLISGLLSIDYLDYHNFFNPSSHPV